jgi:hypothetical protein
MAMAEASRNLNAVADLWFRWLDVVRDIVDPSGMGKNMSAHDYRNLHSALVKACQYSDGADAEMAERLLQVKRTVSPWVTYESLVTADQRFLRDILKQAEPISAVLRRKPTVARPAGKHRVKPVVWLLAFAVGLVVGWLILTGSEGSELPYHSEIRLAIVRTKYMLSRFSFLQIFSAATILILLIVGPLMYRTRKS